MLSLSTGGVAITGSRRPSLKLELFGPTLDPRITFTRASGATYFNSAGVLTTAGNNVARFDYDPSTLAARGLLIEEQRVNSIRNNTMQGAVAGTPGTAPTNWQVYGSASGLTQQIVGVGTESGISYIDIKYAGTTSGAQNNVIFARPESNIQVAALNGQSWTQSAYVRLVGGSLSNITINVGIVEYSGAGAALAGSRTTITPTAAGLATQTYSHTRALNNASTAFVVGGVEMTFVSGVAIDITLRIGLPQLEQGAFATSVIPTTGSTATRNADSASITGANFSSWYNATEGTFYAEAFNLGASTFRVAVEGADASTFRDFSLGFDGSLSRANFTARYQTGNFDVFSPNSSMAANTVNKLAGSYSASSADLAYNGLLSTNKAAVTQRIPADRMFIGSRTGTASFLNGYIRRISFYPRRLSSAELQAITA